jgi:hypothetical protein
MQRSPCPRRFAAPHRRRLRNRVQKVCGIATLVGFAAGGLPRAVEAQATGTMQVLANVARADEAWNGLSGAQAMIHSVALAPGSSRARQVEISLARIRYQAVPPAEPGGSPRPTVTIQYLRN